MINLKPVSFLFREFYHHANQWSLSEFNIQVWTAQSIKEPAEEHEHEQEMWIINYLDI